MIKKKSNINKFEKGWGYELWLHNDEKYCGKILNFNKGKKCSLHFHKLKTETFYLNSGLMCCSFFELSNEGTIKLETFNMFLLTPGDVVEVPTMTAHQMLALQDSELFEFSTEHFEDDSYRLVKGN